MANRSRRVWLLYLAILFNAAVYLDYMEATVLTFVWRSTGQFGDFIRLIGWERAFDAVDLLVVAWLLGAIACLFVRRPFAHRFAVMTNLFLAPCAIIALERHYQYYQQYLDAYPSLFARLAGLFHVAAIRGSFLLIGALLLLAPSVRSRFETKSSTTNPHILNTTAAMPCFLFCAAVIYVRAPW
jgi:hypothetical protein